ncbi:MAG: hypothetical protein ACI4CX_02575, partial [Candidatus Weimeria sp.]
SRPRLPLRPQNTLFQGLLMPAIPLHELYHGTVRFYLTIVDIKERNPFRINRQISFHSAVSIN